MLRLTLPLLLLSLATALSAQDKTFYPDGTLKSEGKMKKGEKIGLWKYYNEKGQLFIEEDHDKKQPNVVAYKEYHPNGQLAAEGQAHQRKKYDDWTWYYDTGKPKTSASYSNDKPVSPVSTFFPNGQLKEKGYITNGLNEGDWEFYHENGRLSTKGRFLHGSATGEWDHWDESGKLTYTNYYPPKEPEYYNNQNNRYSVYGAPDGEFKRNYPKGATEVIGQVKYQKKTGKWTWYFENGNVKEEGEFDNGTQVGEWKTYHENGKLRSVGNYGKNGSKIFGWKTYYPGGQLESEEIREDRSVLVAYYISGEVKKKTYFILGVKTEEINFWKDGTQY